MSKHIVRVLRAKAKPGCEAQFRAFLTKDLPLLLEGQPGLLDVQIGLPMKEDPSAFAVITTWESLTALKRFVGPEWWKVYPTAGSRFLRPSTTTVTHHYSSRVLSRDAVESVPVSLLQTPDLLRVTVPQSAPA